MSEILEKLSTIPLTRKCPTCGVLFETYDKEKRYCSNRCRNGNDKKRLPSNRKLPKRKNDSFGWKEKTEGEQIMESMME